MVLGHSNWDLPQEDFVISRRTKRWSASSLTLTITEQGDIKASAPCNEYRLITPEVAEDIAARLLKAATRARKVRDEAKERVYPDINDLVTN